MEADHAFDLALQQDPELYEALFFRARHCFIAGRRAEASDYYRRAMKSRPDDYQCPLLAAPIEDELGRPESAAALRSAGIALAERHLQLNPDDARALYLSAAGWAAQGDHRARPFAERAREMRPDDPVLLYHVGCVLAALNQLEPAIDCLEEAARLGFAQKAWYENDGSLNPLRQYSRFQAVLDSLT
jgi:adenylate cyclase